MRGCNRLTLRAKLTSTALPGKLTLVSVVDCDELTLVSVVDFVKLTLVSGLGFVFDFGRWTGAGARFEGANLSNANLVGCESASTCKAAIPERESLAAPGAFAGTAAVRCDVPSLGQTGMLT